MYSSASRVWVGFRETIQLYYRYMLIAAVIFSVGAVVGISGGVIVGQDTAVDEDSLGQTTDSESIPELTTQSLFIHNGTVAMLFLIVGVLTAGIGTVFQLLYNGFMIGAMVGIATVEIGVPGILMLLVPHGVFELPALFLAAAIPLRFWILVIKQAQSDETDLLEDHGREVGRSVLLVAVLLLVAAGIEAELTVPIAEAVTGISV